MVSKGQHIVNTDLKGLIAGCLASDRSCQKEIYSLFSPAMMSLCMRYTKDRQEAEEVLQDGFLQMYKRIQQFKNTGTFEGWLRKIMINCALQKYRRKSDRYRKVAISEEIYFLPSDLSVSNQLQEKELIRLIQSLPPACRLVFNLYVFEGLKHREIARLLEISEGTSKSNLFDARNILKKQLRREFKIAK
ncbi:MAG TPA: RNA polymerase sigma factor [Puia sp.]|nr:RNA polymerase sigma factor [Puia sp.]